MRTGSFRNAIFKGQAMREFGLFTALSSIPLLTMDARTAAQKSAISRRSPPTCGANRDFAVASVLTGTTTRQSTCQRVAPSTIADSSSSTGTSWM